MKHAEHLRHHRVICDQWIVDKNSVKTHILRLHASAWYQCNPTMGEALEHFRSFMIRDQPCPLCLKPVYGVSRHLIQCPVAMQMAFLLRVQALSIDVFRKQQLKANLSQAQASRLLQDPSIAAASDVTHALQQSCHICNESVIDVQSWKRHMKQKHSEIWARHEGRPASELQKVTLGRPCPYCQTEYQKTPAVHANKCLPLLQVVFCSLEKDGISVRASLCDLGVGVTVQDKSEDRDQRHTRPTHTSPTHKAFWRTGPRGSRSEELPRRKRRRTRKRTK